MMNRTVLKVLSLTLALCMALGMSASALAEGTASVAGFEALLPIMDLVCAASQYSPNAPESVPGEEGALSVAFTDALFKVGVVYGSEAGVTEAMLTDTNAQAEYLSKIFAAQLPQLEPVTVTEGVNGFIGFHPVTVKTGTDGATVQIIGEIYMADKPMRQMAQEDFADIQWPDRAVFTFKSDSTAMNGFRLTGFTVGTDLSLENEMQGYYEEIAVEYQSKLGFTLLYPAVFTDDMLVEDEDGVSAQLPDGSASFFAKRVDNATKASLADYIGIIANGISNCTTFVDEAAQNGTVFYTTDDGYAVFDVYILTEDHIYQAELKYLTSLMEEYSMFTTYLRNSFVANELNQG